MVPVWSRTHVYSPVQMFQKGSTEPQITVMMMMIRELHSILELVDQGWNCRGEKNEEYVL